MRTFDDADACVTDRGSSQSLSLSLVVAGGTAAGRREGWRSIVIMIMVYDVYAIVHTTIGYDSTAVLIDIDMDWL